ncbi:MAG: EpsI family protein [Proteobacteria bacterium]|nr:EpsI family protein [Pseudomonadota bacterium]
MDGRKRSALSGWGWGHGAAFAGVAALLLAFRDLWLLQPVRSIADPLEAWFFQASETAPQLIYAVLLYLLWRRRRPIRAALDGPGNPLGGALVLLAATLFYGWGRWVAQIDLLFDAFVIWVIGATWALGGRRLLAVVALPLLFLWISRPLPPLVSHHLHHALQLATAQASYAILDFVHPPVFQSGDLLEFHGSTFEVIETCSGLRIILTVFMTSLLFSDIFCRRTGQKLAVILSAPLVGFAVNTARVVTLVLNPFGEVGPLHSVQGMAMIFAGVLLLGAIDVLAGRLSSAPKAPPAAPPVRGGGNRRWRAGGVVASALLLAGISVAPSSAELGRSNLWRFNRIPLDLGGWQGRDLDWDDVFWGTVQFSSQMSREYTRGRDRVTVLVAQDDRLRRQWSGLSPKTRLLGRGWELDRRERVSLDGPLGEAEEIVVRHERERELAYHWRIGSSAMVWEALRWLAALDLATDGKPPPIVTVRVGTRLGYRGEEHARETLEVFLESFIPALEKTVPRAQREALGWVADSPPPGQSSAATSIP